MLFGSIVAVLPKNVDFPTGVKGIRFFFALENLKGVIPALASITFASDFNFLSSKEFYSETNE